MAAQYTPKPVPKPRRLNPIYDDYGPTGRYYEYDPYGEFPVTYDGPVSTGVAGYDPYQGLGEGAPIQGFFVAGTSPDEIKAIEEENAKAFGALSVPDQLKWNALNSPDPSWTWARNRNLSPVLYYVALNERTGSPLPPQVKQFLDYHAGGATPGEQWSAFVRDYQNRESGPDLWESFTHKPTDTLEAFTGNPLGMPGLDVASLETGKLSPVSQAALVAGAGMLAGGAAANAVGGGSLGAATGGAAAGAANSALTGADLETAILTGAVSGGTSSVVGGGAVGNAAGQLAAAAVSDQDMDAALRKAGISAGLGTLAETNKTSGYDLGGGLSVDASGAVTGGMFSSLGTDDIVYEAAPVQTYAPTPVNTAIDTDLGSGLTLGGGGGQGVRFAPVDSLSAISAPAASEPELRIPPNTALGDPLSFINTGGSTFSGGGSPLSSFALSSGEGVGLRSPSAPNLEIMGGGQGITAPTNAVLGDPASFVNSPEILAAVEAGIINENGMLPLGTGAALGDPTSPINAGTFAQPGVETSPGMLSGIVAEPAGAMPVSAPSQPARATVVSRTDESEPRQPAQEQSSGQPPEQPQQPPESPLPPQLPPQIPPQPQRPPTPTRKYSDEQVGTLLEKLAAVGVVPPSARSESGIAAPSNAPQRQEGQSDEQYAQALVNYINSALAGLGIAGAGGKGEENGQSKGPEAALPPGLVDLSAQRLADLGLTPGTQEYYEYIMSQLDDVIARLLNGNDPNDKAFSSKIRAKTRGEMEALYRVLYVRGVLGQMMGSGRYTDPFTGIEEDVIGPDGATFNPSMGAYQRGLARFVQQARGMNAGDLRKLLGGMLGRNPDLFRMQAALDARRRQEALAAGESEEFDPRKRRGMLPL